MSCNTTNSHAAFTLIEITLVVIAVALVIGGIIAGRSMVENAALQSVVADFDMYRQAAVNYKTKYNQLPGDHSTATSQTSEDPSCAATSNRARSDGPSNVTCNGNGDGMIIPPSGTTGSPLVCIQSEVAGYSESLLAWQHLVNEKLIPGQFNGTITNAASGLTPGINVPISKLEGATFLLRYFPTDGTTNDYFKTTYDHVLFFGAPTTDSCLPTAAALTTAQAHAIDLKIDDGKPGLGKVLTSPFSVRPCPTTNFETNAEYDSSLTDPACALIFITGF